MCFCSFLCFLPRGRKSRVLLGNAGYVEKSVFFELTAINGDVSKNTRDKKGKLHETFFKNPLSTKVNERISITKSSSFHT